MANFRGFSQPSQNQPGMGNPYQGTGFNNLDNFLNKGNIDWGNAQGRAPDPMNLAQGRTQPESQFENWMYGASSAPTQNALKETTMPGYKDASEPVTAAKSQPVDWTIDNFPFDSNYWTGDKFFDPFKMGGWDDQQLTNWRNDQKKMAFDDFMTKGGKNTKNDASGTQQVKMASPNTAPMAAQPAQPVEQTFPQGMTPSPTGMLREQGSAGLKSQPAQSQAESIWTPPQIVDPEKKFNKLDQYLAW